MSLRRGLRLAALTVAALVLAGCTGLPMSGPPNAGLAVGGDSDERILTPRADGPRPGATPEQIVAGFLEAGKTPANSWEIAREFLTPDYAARWKPEASVQIDSSIVKRDFHSNLEGADEKAKQKAEKNAKAAEVRVQFDLVADLDANGSYTGGAGTAKAEYQLVRDGNGEWRIAEGRDGITLDAVTFEKVYEKFSLAYFDRNWSHLVSDLRWFPRRRGMATTISRALISGEPSSWLAPAVKNAFPADVSLVGDSVTVSDDQIATVSLTRTALEASGVELSRMRTALEASLAGAGVSEVQLSVDGIPVTAQSLTMDEVIVDPGVLVLTADGFGTASADGAVSPVTTLSAEIGRISAPISSIDVSLDGTLAAVQLRDGHVYSVREGMRNELAPKVGGLIAPSLDPFGYTWTVPAAEPHELQAWSADVDEFSIAEAWPAAESISHMRVSADGAKVAAVVTSDGQRQLVVASIIRGAEQAPTGLGDMTSVAPLETSTQGIAWVGSDTIAVLSDAPDPQLTTYLVGGPSTVAPAPADSVAVAGSKTVTGLRVLSADGAVSALRGSFWQESFSDVLVLGTRAGY